MFRSNDITEDMVRKYAKAEIVHELDESIKSYRKWIMKSIEANDPCFADVHAEDVEKYVHLNAMCWLKRKYYELYSLSPTEPEQIETYKRLHQMEIESSLDNLMGEPVKEVELMQI